MAIEQVTAVSVFADWKFWSFLSSVVAITLSQLPPLYIVFRRAGLTAEVFSDLFLTHKYGNPNCQLHVVLANSGGRKVRVKSLAIEFKGASGKAFTLPARTYVQKQGDKDALLFTPFSLKPGEEFAHIINFYAAISRVDDQYIRDSVATLRKDIQNKREQLTDKSETVRADEQSVEPFLRLFDRQFKWLPDEYEMVMRVKTVPENALPDQPFRFVVFESDSGQMKEALSGYPFGAGVLFDSTIIDGVIVPIQKS